MPAARYWSFIASATDDEMRRGAGGIFFGGAENQIGDGVLKIAKRRSVNRVDDDRHAGAPGGQAAQDARLAAVRVDDVRRCARRIFSSRRSASNPSRMDRPDEFGNDDKAWSSASGGRLPETAEVGIPKPSGPVVGPEIKVDFDAGFLPQTEDGGDGVFLRAADDEPRDDVGDAHVQ